MTGILALFGSKAFRVFLAILVVIVAAWFCIKAVDSWEQRLIEQGYQKAMTEQGLLQREALTTITAAVTKFGEQTTKTADAVESNEKALDAKVAIILKTIKAQPLIVKNAAGDCRLTKEATQSWNALQNTVQRP